MREIVVRSKKYGNHVAYVDDEDYEHLNIFRWFLCRCGPNNYAGIVIKESGRRRILRMHRLLLNPGKQMVDHINNNGLDNQRHNLRLVTAQQNHFNRHRTGGKTSKYKGVSWNKQQKRWSVQLKLKGKRVFQVNLKSEIEAAKAYDTAALKYFGEFAKLNFPLL